jgi:thymidylate synthase (FAD)
MRYTGARIIGVADRTVPVADVFYVRPPGTYRDRQGDPYEWTMDDVLQSEYTSQSSAMGYASLRERGVSEEHARGVLTTNYYQNAMVSGSLRFWLHLLDMRSKADAQDEIRTLMAMVAKEVRAWVPEIFDWYASHRLGKALLAP